MKLNEQRLHVYIIFSRPTGGKQSFACRGRPVAGVATPRSNGKS